MSGAIQVAVKPPMASPMNDQPAPWDSSDVDLEAKRLDALGEIDRLHREGKRAQSREQLTKLREKWKGTPAEAGYTYMLGLEDYSQALDDHIKQLAAERRNGPAPITDAPPEDVAPVREQVAWAGEGGPEISGDAAQEYASATQAANDDAATSAMFDAYDSENVAETGVGPDSAAQLKAPELPVGAAAKPRGGAEPGSQGATRSLRDLITGKPKLPTFTDDPVHNAGLVAADIGTGIVESPKAILGGVRNGINELAGSIDSAGAWVATQAMLAEGDTAGAARLAARRAAGETVLENQLPAVGDPRTGTGKLVEGITQFVTGFVAGGKVLKGTGWLATVGKSAFSDAFAFDPARYRLSNLIEENPALKNPVTEFLATKPGDTEAEGRLKNVLESGAIGLGVQGLTNVFIAGLKGLRSVNHLTPKPVSPAEAEAIAVKQVQEGTAPLGDREAPLVTTRTTGEPPAGTVNLGANANGKDVFINFARIDTPEDVKALMQQTANLHANEIAQAQRNSPVWFRGQGSGTIAEIKPAISENTGGVPVVFASSQKDVAHGYADATGMPTATVHALTSEAKNPLVLTEWAGKNFDKIPMASIIKKAKAAGHDAVIFKRIDDNADALGPESGRSLSDVIAWLDPKGFKAAPAAAIKAGQTGISHNATKQLADDMGMTVNDLLARRRGPNGARQPFTAEESLAARRLLVASGEKLHELAQRAAGPNAGEIDLFNLRKMMATHQAIQNEVLGARTETARALAAWRIEAGAGQAQLNAIKAMMETAGPDTAKMARELVNLKATGAPPAAIAQYVRKSAIGSIGQGIREVYVNGLLSGPLTHIVNTFGNTLTLGLSVAERAVARTISKHVTASDAVAEGEASAMLHGIIEGQRDALRLAWKATGDLPAPDHLGKIDLPRPAAIASSRGSTTHIFNGTDTAFGTAVNVLGATTRAPSLLMAAADKYFRAVNYRAQLHAYAQRTVASEGLAGKAASQRYRELIDNPPDQIKIDADQAALTNTFNNAAGWFGSNLLKVREAGGPLNATWLVVPFIRTPVNIARYAFERTPLAPLVGQWREQFARGGADRDMALAKVATGTMVMGLAQAGASSGYVTGALPSDSGEAQLWAREGRQPYSVKVGDNWYSFNRADPFGMTMGFAADIENTLARGEVSPKDVDEWQEVVAGGIAAIANTATDKTFMRGFSQFNDMLSDPERYASQQINSTITGFVPFTALSSWATRLQDPTVKDARTPLDAISARIPGLADRIIPKRNLWGETRTDPAVGYNAFSPLRQSEEAASPIDAELDRLRVYPKGLGWKESVLGTDIDFSDDPKALDEFRRLAGNGWKHPAWGLGLKDFLDQTVSGQGPMSQVYKMYADGTEGGKAAFIKQWITKYREGAARSLLDDPKFVGFKAHWEQQREAQRNARQRVNLE